MNKMAEDIAGYLTPEIIRLTTGSPSTTSFAFSKVSESVLIHNLSSTVGIWFNLNGATISTIGSTLGYVPPLENITLDLRTGSIGILPSGTTSEVQVIIMHN